MSLAINTMLDYFKNYYLGNEKYLVIALICLLYLLIFEKEIRKKYAIPLVICAIVILNPYIYMKIFSKTNMYWRLFNIFSLHIIIATAAISLISKLKKDIFKIIAFIVICSIIVVTGYGNVFENETLAEYVDIVNLEKIPYGIAEICDAMLEIEDEPNIVCDPWTSCYTRLYSGKIRQLWGRNAAGFISKMSDDAKKVYQMSLIEGDMYGVFEWTSRHDYNFVVLHNRIADDYIAAMFGYKEVYTTYGENEFHVYYKVGIENTDYADMLLSENGD